MTTDFADMIENRLDEVEDRMTMLAMYGMTDEALALGAEYITWAKVEPGEDYKILWMEDMNPRKRKRKPRTSTKKPPTK